MMVEERADSFLRMIRRAQRGRLKVYLGYCAGVGKTYQMLQEGHRLAQEGIGVVIGLVETHGRADVARLAEGLEVIPRRCQEYRGIAVEEMDVNAILVRKPRVALIDELAHTNVPGSVNPKRYQDVQDILAAGIHVITTMNVQHLESLYNIVEKAVGVKVRERLPDSVLAEADQIVSVDLTTEDLRKRLVEGKIYPSERIGTALENFFLSSNLETLRELTLRELASQIDIRRRETLEEERMPASDQVMVCLSSRGPNSENLLRYASRLAGKLNRNWYAVYVQTREEEATVIETRTQRMISETLSLAKQLGAMVFTYKGEDIAQTILGFAEEYRVGHIVIGRPSPAHFWQKLWRRKNVVQRVLENAKGSSVIVVDTREEEPVTVQPLAGDQVLGALPDGGSQSEGRLVLSQLIAPGRILIWDYPVGQKVVLRSLVDSISAGGAPGASDAEHLFAEVMKREEQGSTFFNEGVGFPHVRLDGLKNSLVAVGVTRGGVSDITTENPIGLVFLILSPADMPEVQTKALALASQAAQDRHLVQRFGLAQTGADVVAFVKDWEESGR
jgi:two-component system sensor histidine kinase KdpD